MHKCVIKYIEINKFDWKEYLKYLIIKMKLDKTENTKVELKSFMEKLGFS